MSAYYNAATIAAQGDLNHASLGSDGVLTFTASTQTFAVVAPAAVTLAALSNASAPAATVAIQNTGTVLATSIAGQDVVITGGRHVILQTAGGTQLVHFDANGSVYPANDNIGTFGLASNRFSVIYAAGWFQAPFFKGAVQAITGVTPTIQVAPGEVVTLDATAGNQTATLSAPTGYSGVTMRITRIDATGNTCTVTTSGGAIRNGTTPSATTYSLPTQYKSVTLTSDGVNWHVTAVGG